MVERGGWLTMLTIASCLEPAWAPFEERRHLAQLLGREGVDEPEAFISRLIELRLLDELEDGRLLVHDSDVWQGRSRKPSDEADATRKRQQLSRERRRDPVTPCHVLSRPVTPMSRDRQTEQTEKDKERDDDFVFDEDEEEVRQDPDELVRSWTTDSVR